MPESHVKVIGPELPGRLVSKKITPEAVQEVRENTPNWCMVATYNTINGASSAAGRCSNRFPDLHWKARTIGGVPSLAAMFDPNGDPPVPRPQH